jgi:uncharacterized repeat protein (TIGR03803 family)
MFDCKSSTFALVAAMASLAPFAASGQSLTTLHAFHTKGQNPYSSVLNVGSHLFGTTYGGGASNVGSVYKIQLAGGNAEASYQDFTGGSDGDQPIAGLIKVGKTLYGITNNGGVGCGTAFKVDVDGANFTVLHTFSTIDAQHPSGNFIYSNGNFYGTGQSGGPNEAGTVFKMDPSGNVTVLYAFTGGTDGFEPYGGLIKIGQYLYGTAEQGGAGYGTVFRVKLDGSHFQVLHTFTGGSDGGSPFAGLTSFQGSLFGVTSGIRTTSQGTVFRIDPNGANYSTVYSFAGGPSDGRIPIGGLVAVSTTAGSPADTVYGTTANGGNTDNGTVFKVDSSGVETTLYSFAGADGAGPEAGMINIPDSDGAPHLYGTTVGGSQWGKGTVFEFTP